MVFRYMHGLESGPQGTKVRILEDSGLYTVHTPVMPTRRLRSPFHNPWLAGCVLVICASLGVMGMAGDHECVCSDSPRVQL